MAAHIKPGHDRISIWGNPWHGLVTEGMLELPPGAQTVMTPGAETTLNGVPVYTSWATEKKSILWTYGVWDSRSEPFLAHQKCPWVAAISRSEEEQTDDVNHGFQWKNSFTLHGDSQTLYGYKDKKLNGFIYFSSADRKRWLIEMNSLVFADNILSGNLAIREFGELAFGTSTENDINIPILLEGAGQDYPDLSGLTTYCLKLLDVKPDGSECLIGIFNDGVKAEPVEVYPQLDAAPRAPLLFTECLLGILAIGLATEPGTNQVLATPRVVSTRAATLGSYSFTRSDPAPLWLWIDLNDTSPVYNPPVDPEQPFPQPYEMTYEPAPVHYGAAVPEGIPVAYKASYRSSSSVTATIIAPRVLHAVYDDEATIQIISVSGSMTESVSSTTVDAASGQYGETGQYLSTYTKEVFYSNDTREYNGSHNLTKTISVSLQYNWFGITVPVTGTITQYYASTNSSKSQGEYTQSASGSVLGAELQVPSYVMTAVPSLFPAYPGTLPDVRLILADDSHDSLAKATGAFVGWVVMDTTVKATYSLLPPLMYNYKLGTICASASTLTYVSYLGGGRILYSANVNYGYSGAHGVDGMPALPVLDTGQYNAVYNGPSHFETWDRISGHYYVPYGAYSPFDHSIIWPSFYSIFIV